MFVCYIKIEDSLSVCKSGEQVVFGFPNLNFYGMLLNNVFKYASSLKKILIKNSHFFLERCLKPDVFWL